MTMNARLRRLGFLALGLLFLTGAAQAQPLAISPKVIESASSTVTVTVTSNGAFNLSGITRQKIHCRRFIQDLFQNPDVCVGEIISAKPRALTMTLRIINREAFGEHPLNIDFGDMVVSLKFTLAPAFVCPNCQPPGKCVNKVCVFPKRSTCNPACRSPARCNEALRTCERPQ